MERSQWEVGSEGIPEEKINKTKQKPQQNRKEKENIRKKKGDGPLTLPLRTRKTDYVLFANN